MSVRYLVDTDWVVDYLHGAAVITDRVGDLIRRRVLALSIVSLAELYEGVLFSTQPSRSQLALRRFVRGVRVLPIDEETAKRFGEERGRLRKMRRHIGDLDLLIAATALRHHLTLLTNNRRHFERIHGLKIESAKQPG
jgi:predicted nucleic acid-binding protein